MTKRLAIIGRPNVGKSTLFNRMVGKQLAIVHDTPGVTRDWKEAEARLGDLKFIAIDTAGIENAATDVISVGMRKQTEAALKRADAVLLMMDGRDGLTEVDMTIAKWVRKQNMPVVLAANKCESGVNLEELYALGFGQPIAIAAAHGAGLSDLYGALQPLLDPQEGETEDDNADADDSEKPIRLALVGRPNVGKSTLLNALLGEERALVSPVAGTTRDTIAEKFEWEGTRFRLVDTAGLRRKARIEEKLEKMATAETLRIIRLAEVVVLVLDANQALEAQDMTIADLVFREGRAVIIALNKWDTIKAPGKLLNEVSQKLEQSLTQGKGIPVVPISALKGKKLDVLMKEVINIHQVWDKRISTGQINRWLEAMVESNPPPLVQGRRVKIRYMTQRKGRPPTFTLFCGTHATPPESYLRYLTNGLRERFEFWGVPIRIEVRKGKNPYAEGGKE